MRVHEQHMLDHKLYFGYSQYLFPSPISFLPHMYLSSCAPLQAPEPPGDNRLLGCQAAEPSEMGRMTTYVPLGNKPGTERSIGKKREGMEKKRKSKRLNWEEFVYDVIKLLRLYST